MMYSRSESSVASISFVCGLSGDVKPSSPFTTDATSPASWRRSVTMTKGLHFFSSLVLIFRKIFQHRNWASVNVTDIFCT